MNCLLSHFLFVLKLLFLSKSIVLIEIFDFDIDIKFEESSSILDISKLI